VNFKLWFWLVVVVFVAAVIGSVPSFYMFKAQKEAKIADLNAELTRLTSQKAEVDKRAAEIDAEKATLTKQNEELRTQVQARVDRVTELEQQLQTARVHAYEPADPGDYTAVINKAFPEMKNSGWSIIETTGTTGRKSLWVRFPLGMVDAFVAKLEESESLGAQKDELKSAVKLQDEMLGLHQRIDQLLEEKSATYMQAYNDALDAYKSANKDFVELLKQPNFKVDVPKRGALIGCTLLGIVLGAAL